MDPSGLKTCTDSQDGKQSQMDALDEVSELHNSDVDSENDFEEDQKSITEDDTDGEKSVHIIFVRDEHEGVSNAESVKTKVGTFNGIVDNVTEERGVTMRLPMQKVRVSAVPCRSVSCPNEDCDADGEVCTFVSEKNSDEEVEDDFDTSGDMMFQVDQRPPVPCNPRKRRKKKFYKVCKACGEMVERQDFISHIREHRRRKLKFAQNLSPNIIEQSVSSFSSVEKISTPSDSSRTASSVICEANSPQSSQSSSLSDRPFKCSVCTETFRTQSSLTIHFKSHSGECSSSCPVS